MAEQRRVRRRRRRDDGPPRRRRPAADGRHRHPAAAASTTTARPPTPPPFPQKGRNALDAAVLGYMNVAALRQHIRPDERIHGIFTEAGDKPNIVPDARRRALVRALADARSARAAEGSGCSPASRPAPTAAGCTMDLRLAGPGLRRHGRQRAVARPVRRRTPRALGRDARRSARRRRGVVGSTDMGNVSYLVPSIHPMIKVVAAARRRSTPPEFARYAGGRRRRPGRARRGQGAGHDGRRPLAAADGVLDAVEGRVRRRRPAN